MNLASKRDRSLKLALALVVIVVALVAIWRIGPALMPAEHIEEGIAVGEAAPVELFVHDARGARLRISEASGEKGLVLILQRSVDWCPFCIAEMKERRTLVGPLAQRGYTLASLTYDSPETLADFKEANAIPFDLLSDPTIAFVDAVGLRDPQYPEDHYANGVPRPAVLVLSPEGAVRAKFVTSDYRQRLDNDEVLELVDSARR